MLLIAGPASHKFIDPAAPGAASVDREIPPRNEHSGFHARILLYMAAVITWSYGRGMGLFAESRN